MSIHRSSSKCYTLVLFNTLHEKTVASTSGSRAAVHFSLVRFIHSPMSTDRPTNILRTFQTMSLYTGISADIFEELITWWMNRSTVCSPLLWDWKQKFFCHFSWSQWNYRIHSFTYWSYYYLSCYVDSNSEHLIVSAAQKGFFTITQRRDNEVLTELAKVTLACHRRVCTEHRENVTRFVQTKTAVVSLRDVPSMWAARVSGSMAAAQNTKLGVWHETRQLTSPVSVSS